MTATTEPNTNLKPYFFYYFAQTIPLSQSEPNVPHMMSNFMEIIDFLCFERRWADTLISHTALPSAESQVLLVGLLLIKKFESK